MNKPCTYPSPVLEILLALACFGVPAQAVAQDQPIPSPYCYRCEAWDQDPELVECDSEDNLVGHLGCTLANGGTRCNTSSLPGGGADCGIITPGLDGWGGEVWVSLDVESDPWPHAVAVTEVLQRAQQAAPAVDVPLEVARHGCTGAIISRRYSPERIAALRLGLRRVTI